MINWLNIVILLAVAVFLVFARRFFIQHGVPKPAARKPFNNHEKIPPIENRSLKDSEGYIPLDNLVISEIPVTKAQEIGHFEMDEQKDENSKK